MPTRGAAAGPHEPFYCSLCFVDRVLANKKLAGAADRLRASKFEAKMFFQRISEPLPAAKPR